MEAAAPWCSRSGYFLSIIYISRWKENTGEKALSAGSTLGHAQEPQAHGHTLPGAGCVCERPPQSDQRLPALSAALEAQTDANTGAEPPTDLGVPEGGCLILTGPPAPHPSHPLSPLPDTLVISSLPASILCHRTLSSTRSPSHLPLCVEFPKGSAVWNLPPSGSGLYVGGTQWTHTLGFPPPLT